MTQATKIGFYLARISSLQHAALVIDEHARLRHDHNQRRRDPRFEIGDPYPELDLARETRAFKIWMTASRNATQDAVYWLAGTSDNPRIAR